MKRFLVALCCLMFMSAFFGNIYGSAHTSDTNQKMFSQDCMKKMIQDMKFQDIKKMNHMLENSSVASKSLAVAYFDKVKDLFDQENRKDVFEYIKSVRTQFGLEPKTFESVFARLAIVAELPMPKLLSLEMYFDKGYHL